MLRSLAEAIRNYFTQTPDPRTVDAMSMTLHDCLRLIQLQPRSSTTQTAKRPDTTLPKMKWNLDSPQSRFIKPA